MAGKVYDRRRLTVDRSPLKQLAVEIGKHPPPDINDLIAGYVKFLEDYGLAALEEASGLDLTAAKVALTNLKALLGAVNLDLAPEDFDPIEQALTFVEDVLVPTGLLGGANWGELYEKLSGTAAPEDALTALSDWLDDNLFGKITAARLPLVGLGQVRDVAHNEFLNGDFDGPDSLRGLDDWDHRADDGFVDGHPLGSAWTVADGTTHIIRSNNIDVKQSVVEFQVRTKYVGLTATAGQNAIRVNVAGYQGNTQTVAPYQIAGVASPAGNSSGWDTLLTFTLGPTPANVDNVNFELVVTGAATAGQIGFDKARAQLADKLAQSYVEGLTAAIASLWSGIQARIDDMADLWDVFGGFPAGTGSGQLTDVATRIQRLDPLSGAFDAAWLSNIAEIPGGISFLKILGIGGPEDIGGSVEETWGQWVGGAVGVTGGVASLPEVWNISNWVSAGASMGRAALDVTNIRNAEPLSSGLLATSSGVDFSAIMFDTAADPSTAGLPINTANPSRIRFERIGKDRSLGYISWEGVGNANITDFRVRAGKLNVTNGQIDWIYGSPNAVGDLAAGKAWNDHRLRDSGGVSTPVAQLASEVWAYELAHLAGTGTHTVAGKTTHSPSRSNSYPKAFAATRTTGATPTSPSIEGTHFAYSAAVPFIEPSIGFDVVIPRSPVTVTKNVVGSSTTPIPTWANHVDYIMVPAAAGGAGGSQTPGISGKGGLAGTWVEGTWDRNTHFVDGTVVSHTIADGGGGGSYLIGGSAGAAGGNSQVSIPGYTVNAPGGAATSGYGAYAGASPGNNDYLGQPYVAGGVQNTSGSNGIAPGGAASGGGYYQNGGKGAPACLWLVFRQ